jgi:branched-chain amino acid transport system substrate-binding protein
MRTTILIIFACLLIVGCQPTTNEQTVTIGGLFALTGYGAAWGEAEQNGVQLAITQANAAGGINGKQITLIPEDTQSKASGALNAYNKLTHVNNINILIGPTWEESASVVTPVAITDNVLLISPSSYKSIYDQNTRTVFSTYPPFHYQFGPVRAYTNQHDIKKIAVVYGDETFSTIMYELFIEEAKRNKWEITDVFKTQLDAKDYRTLLLKIKASDAQLIYIPMESDELGTLMKQAKELGVTTPIFSIDSVEGDDTFESYGSATEGVLYPAPVTGPNYARFEQQYKEMYGDTPDISSAANAYDATNLIIEALRSGAATTEEIAVYLHAVQNYAGASGNITFTERGIIKEKEYVLKTIRNGSYELY